MKLRPFELALVIIFIVLGLAALAVVSSYNGGSSNDDSLAFTGSVEIWGVLPKEAMEATLTTLADQNESFRQVSYREIEPNAFGETLTNALADGVGPDIVMMSHEQLVDTRRRIAPYDYETLPPRDIRDAYVEGAQIFALSDGMYALPIAVDPIVMYWNRDILATNGFLAAPRTWEELINVQFPELIERDFSRNINRAVVAMGEFANVRNAFGMLSMLLIQGGSAGVVETDRGYEIRLREAVSGSGNPMRAVFDFYTRFSQPSNALYSWNRSLQADRAAFVGEELAFYFGYASEAREIERLNPNLNFDIAEVPQGGAASVRRTYGQFYGLALLRSTNNAQGAYTVMAALNRPQVSSQIAVSAGMAPASRSAVAAGTNDTYGRVAYGSASIAYGWLNPELSETEQIFATIVSDVTGNRRDLDQAVSDGVERLERVY